MTEPEAGAPTRLQHIVLLSFPDDLSTAEDAELRAMVRSWPREIGTMSEARIGTDLTGARTRGYQYLLYTVFPDTKTLAEYVAHPVHQQLVRFLDDRRCQRLAFDYYLDETTDAFASRG
ncbi:MAG: Stress responsive Barrel Domain [Nocardioidaceae bacterium]|nr:Stress responsive Barrel Domain [Nocardioidaceae bacterium]